MELIVVLSTFPDIDIARKTATTLVVEGLAACVNLCPGVESIYRWEGKVETAGEVLALIKTTRKTHDALEARLKELHPYEVPEILALPVEKVSTDYAKWLHDSVRVS